MLKSCSSFSYKITTTGRLSERYIRTLFFDAKSSRTNNSSWRKYTSNQNPLFATSSSAKVTNFMPKRKNGAKFYAVAVGRTPGIYPTWEECQSNVIGYPNARFKKFSTEEEARSFIASAAKTVPNNSNSTTEIRTKQKRRKAGSDKIPEDPTLGSATNPITVESAVVATSKSGTNPGDPKDRNDYYPHKLNFHIMFDGGSRGNPHGHAGAGAYILKRSFYAPEQTASTKRAATEIHRHTTRVRNYLGMGKLTNNQAEYMGLITGLEKVLAALEKIGTPGGACDILDDVTVLVQGDSDLIVKQMKGIYACKSANLKSYHQRAKTMVQKVQKTSKTMGATFDITFEHVYRESNTIADGLANEAMDAQRSWTTSEGQDKRNSDAKPTKRTESDEDAIEV